MPLLLLLVVVAIVFLMPREGESSRKTPAPSSQSTADSKGRFIQARRDEKLKEIDLREARTGMPPAASQMTALEKLRAEIPGVQVNFDPITGAASHVMAPGKFLTKGHPGGKDPYDPVRDFVSNHEALFGHGAAALAAGNARVTREDVTAHNGMRTVVWQQEVAGVPVFQTILKANLTRDGDLVTLGSHFLRDAAQAAGDQAALVAAPPLSAPQALTHVATTLGEALNTAQITPKTAPQGVEQSQKLSAPGHTDTTAHLSWVPMGEDTLRLAWQIETFSLGVNEMFRLLVDAKDGTILVRQRLGAEISNATFRVFTGDSPTPMKPSHSTPLSTQPAEVSRTLLTLQALNTTASPDGWINDGQNQTVGNNVDAHLDADADNVADLPRTQGSPSRVFDFSFNSSLAPTSYQDACVTQLFYYNNWIHDRMYELGFTETAGNFQTSNFGRGGYGNDAVQADAQDGSGTNNANFYTPSDGSPGRMQMYIWTGPTPDRDSAFDGDIVIHEYGHGISNRLVGGGVGIYEWQSRGMGEGWSDFYAMALQSKATEDVNGVYAMGGYSTYQLSGMTTNHYFGIRRYPYCTDMSKAPLTYKDIDPTQASPHTGVPLSPRYSASNDDPSQYHGQGEVWCNMLLECRANIINHHGWEVGNELMLRLVTDGLKLTPANPTFIQARDAIIQADLVNNSGANFSRLWAGFAKRGMGASASGPEVYTTTGVVEAYDIPDDLSVTPYGTFTATGVLGGAITPTSRIFTTQNIGTSPLDWTAAASQPWLVLSRTSGGLSPGAMDTVTVSFGTAANALPVGVHTANVTFTNTTSGATIQRDVTLTIEPMRITILAEPFDSTTLSPAWTITGTGTFRTQATPLNGPRSSNHLTMDSSADDGVYARNEATLTVNLAGQHDVELSFWAKSFGEEPDGPPASPFINGADFDGVAVSADGGTTWHEVQALRSLTSEWVRYTVDLDAATASRGISYSANFKIRFNQYDNFAISTDGIAIDDILIAQNVNNSLALALPVSSITEGAPPVTATLAISPVQSSELTVTLTANRPDVSVPATVTVPAGTTQVTFPVTIVDDALLDGTQAVTLRAEAPIFSAGTTGLAVHDNETSTLTVDAPVSATEGTVGITAFVNVPTAVDAPVTVALESSNPAASIPTSVIIPAGQSSAQFFINLTDDGFINGSRSTTFTASVTGWTTGTDSLTIQDDENASLVLAQTIPALAETDGARTNAARVAINGLAQNDVVISLTSSDTGELTVPASVTLPAGATQVNFGLTAVNDSDADGPQNVTVTASAPGFINGTLVVMVHDDEAAPVAWNPRPAHLSTSNAIHTDLAWSTSEGNLIKNGSFESGNFDGWSFNVPQGPMFKLQNGSLDPSGNDTPTPPYNGTASMIFAPGSSSGLWIMHQDVAVPPDGPVPMLQWMQRIRNTHTIFSATQQYRVEIRDPATDAVLATPFLTVPGSPLFQDWAAQSVNLSTWRGRSVRVAFVVQSGNAVLNVLLDDITLQQRAAGSTYDVYFGTTPTPGAAELLGNTSATTFDLPPLTPGTSYHWQIVTRNGAQSMPGPVWQFSVPAVGSVAKFAWGGIPSPQSTGTDIPVTITALDALGNVATGFTGKANLSAVLPAVTQPSVLITEHSTWTTDEVEFTNVTSAPVDVSGWKILLTQFNSFPAPYITFTVPAGTSLTAGGTFRIMESGTAPGAFPLFRTGLSTNLSTTTNAYVVLMNARSEVVDFVCLVGDPRRVTVPLPAEAWSGSSLPGVGSNPASFSYQRIGSQDGNNAADWRFQAATPGALNQGLSLPFAAPATPPSVTPLQTASFTAGVWSGNTQILGAAQSLRLRATESGGKSGDSGLLTLSAPNGQLVLNAGATVAEGSGTNTGFGTVTLPTAAAMPVTVSFIVNSSEQASVAAVTIPAGASSAAFDLTVVDDSLLEGTHGISVVAVAAGFTASSQRSIAITDNENTVLTLTAPANANEGAGILNSAVTVTSADAPVNAVTIALSSSDTTEALLPATVTLPAGQTSVTANLTIVNDTLLDGAQTVTLTASAAGFANGTAQLVVNDNEPATLIVTAPATVNENAPPLTSAGSVTIGGQAAVDRVISLQSSDPASLTVPASVTIPTGQSSATFAITAVDDSTAEFNVDVIVTASAAGLTDGLANILVSDDELAAFRFASIPSPQKAAKAFPVTISARNMSGDALSGFTGAAMLNAGDNTLTPASTTAFTAGSWTGNVTLGSPAEGQTLTATGGGRTGTSDVFSVDAGSVASFTLSTIPSPQAASTPFPLTVTAKDALDQDLTSYAGPARLVQLSGPQQVQVGSFAGATTMNTPLQTSGFNRQRTVMLVQAAEIPVVGQLTSMSLHFITPPPPLARLIIRVKPTSLTTLVTSAPWDNSGWKTVYDAPLNVSSPAWGEFAFSTPYIHSGSSNLLMEIIHVNPANSTRSPILTATSIAYNGVISASATSSNNNVNTDPTLWTGTTPGKSYSGILRPLLRFNSRPMRDASPATLTAFTAGVFNGQVSAPFGGSGQTLGVLDVAADVLSVSNDFNVTASGTLAVAFSGNATEGGASITGTVTASAAPGADLVVSLTATDAADVTLPATVTIPTGTTTTTFAISAVDDALLETMETITVEAAGAGYDAGSGSLTLTDNDSAILSVTLPASVKEGDAVATGTVTASVAAQYPATITLAASPTGLVTVPASVSLPAGQTSSTFSISAVNNSAVDGTRTATVSASRTGWSTGDATLDVLDNEARTLTVNLATATPGEGAGTITGTVALSGTTATALTVNLSSDDTSEATVPATVTINAGNSSVTFTLTLVDDALTDGTRPVTLTATAAGFSDGTRSFQVLDNDVAGFNFASIPSPQIRNTPFNVTVRAVDVNGVVIPSFTSTVTLSGSVIAPVVSESFVNGTWTGTLSPTQTGTGVTLTASGSGGLSGVSNSFDVLGTGSLTQFAISPISAPQAAGIPVPVTVTAQDAAGNTVTGYNGNVSFTANGPSSSDVVTSTGTGATLSVLLTGSQDGRNQSIYTPAEVGPARTLRSLAMELAVLPGQPLLNNFTIRMKHTTKPDFSAAGSAIFESTGWTTVYRATTQSITALGWNTFQFQNLFAYDGVQNLMVDISFDNSSASSNATVRCTGVTPNRAMYATSSSNDGDPLLWNGATSPNVQVTFNRINLRLSGFMPVTVTPAASAAFVGGQWTGDLTFASSGPAVVLRALNGSGLQGMSNAFALNGSVLDHFDFNAIGSVQTVGATIPVTVTAKDANNMPVTSFSGPAALSGAEREVKASTGSGTSTWSIPLGSQSRTQRMQVIYTAAEVGGVGRTLTGLDLNATTAPGDRLSNFTIRIKHTTKADFTAAGTAVWESGGWTTVYQQDVTIPSTGWTSFPFSTPFEYDGTRNLMVDFSYHNAGVGAIQGAVQYTASSTNRAILRQVDTDEGSPLLWNEGSAPVPAANTIVPNARFSSGSVVTLDPTTTGGFAQGVWAGTVTVAQPKAAVQITASAGGRTGTSEAFKVNSLGALTITLAATAAEGAAPLTGTVTRTGATTNALVVSLSSSDSTEATLAAGTVTIAAGATSAPFTANIADDATPDGPQTAVITASAANFTSGTSDLTVTDNEALTLAVSLPLNLSEATTAAGNGYVTINRPAASPVTVTLSSSDTTELTVPTNVTIPTGATSITFAMTVVNDSLADGPQPVVVTATSSGYVTGTGSTVVQDNEAQTFTLGSSSTNESSAPYSVSLALGGTTSVAVPITVTVNDTSELLVAANTSTAGSSSVTVTVAANASSTTLAFVPQDDAVKDGNQSVTLTLSAPGYPTLTRFVSVVDDEVERYFIAPVGSPQTANAAFGVTVTARNVDDSIITTNSQTLSLTAANSSGAIAMAPASVALVSGTGTVNALFTAGATGVSITATDSQGVSAQSSLFDVVGAGGLARFDWATLTGPQLIENPLAVTVTAKDAASNTVSSYAGPASLKAFTPAGDLTIGSGSSSWTTPLGNLAHGRTQSLYLQSELGAARRLTGLALNILASSSTVLNNFTIRMKHASAISFGTAAWDNTGWTTVFSGGRTFNATGWQNTVFTRPFDYDGFSNLLVDISFGNSTSGTAVGCQYTTASATRSVTLNTSTVSSGLPTTWTGTTPAPATSTNLLNVRFTNATPVVAPGGTTTVVTAGTSTELSETPMGTYYHDQRTQMIYTANELGGAKNITAVALDVVTPPGQVMNAFTIRMKHTTLTDYFNGGAWEATGWTTVYATNQTVSSTGWNTFNLSTPFAYNGVENLLVDISFNNSSYTSNGLCSATFTPNPRAITYQTDSYYGDPLLWSGTSSPFAFPSYELPNMRFSSTPAVVSTVVPSATGTFNNGVWTGSIVVTQPGTNLFLAADDPVTGVAGYSNAITFNSGGALALTFLGTLAEGSGTVANGGTLTLPAAPGSPVTVNLSSASTANLTVPATVTVPAGQTSVAVPVTIIDDALLEGPHSIAVTATAPGYTRVTTSASVADNDGGTFTLAAPDSVGEGYSFFTVILNTSAASPVPVTVALSSSDTTELTVPATVTLPANALTTTFLVTVVDDTLMDGTQTSTLTASAPGWISGTATVSVNDNETLPEITLSVSTLPEGDSNASSYVRMYSDPPSARVVTLTSSDPSLVSVPASVTVPAGSTQALFTSSASNDNVSTGTRYVTISASSPGFLPIAIVCAVSENDAAGYRISNITGTPLAGAPTSVTITAVDPGGSIVYYANTPVNLSAASGAGAVPISPAVTGTFNNGVWTGSVSFNQVATGIVLTASGPFGSTGSSAPFNTTYGALDHFTWGAVPATQAASTPFEATVTAKDMYDNTVATFASPTTLEALVPVTPISVGTGTVSSAKPLPTATNGARSQLIYLPGEMGGPKVLTGLALNITTAPGVPLSRFAIRLKHTTKGSYPSSTSFDNTGLTTVFLRASETISTTGWRTFDFDAPFTYDGVSNLLVDIVYDNSSTGANAACQSTSVSPSRHLAAANNRSSGWGDPYVWNSANNSTVSSMPNVRFSTGTPRSLIPTTVPAFSNGTWTGPVTTLQAGNGIRLRATAGEAAGMSGLLNVTSVGTLALTVSTAAAEGDAPLTATVSLAAAAGGDLVVPLASTNLNAATVPASVTIPAGQTSASFAVTIIDDSVLDGTQTTQISALLPGYEAGVEILEVADNESTSITLTLPATIAENAAVTTGTITLGAAPAVDVVFPLSSSLTTDLTVPASVTVLAGSTSATFPITPVDDNLIDFAKSVTVSTSMAGWTGGSASISVTDNEAATFSLSFISSVSEQQGTLAATVNTPAAVESATTITLTSADLTEATVPATVTLAAGTNSASFTITVVNDTAKDGTQTFAITAAASGFTTGSKNLTVADDEVHNFLISVISGPKTRNAPFSVTFTARDIGNSTITTYSGTPVLTANDGATALIISPSSVSGFFSGSATANLTIGSFATNAVITVTDTAAAASGSSNAFAVGSGAHAKFGWASISSPKTQGTPFSTTINAQDAYGNPVSTFTGTAALSIPTGEVSTGSAGSTVSPPLRAASHDCRSQLFYTATEMGGAKNITSAALNVVTLPGQALNGFTIRMKHTTRTDLSSFVWETTDWTTCYQSNQTISATGWNTFTFTTPFAYNGTDHVIVDISFNNSSGSGNGTVVSTFITSVRHIYSVSNSTNGDPLTWSGSTPTALPTYDRPDIRFGYGGTGGTVTPTTTGNFVAGVWTGNVTVPSAATNIALQATSGSFTGVSNSFSVGSPTVLTVTLPASAAESAGTVSGTISMGAALASPLVVTVGSNDTTEAQPATSTVTIPTGSTSVGFTLNIVNDSLKDGSQNAIITASAANATNGTATISVVDDDPSAFAWSTISSPKVSGESFSVTINARTVDGLPATAFNGSTAALTATVAGAGATVTPANTGVFSNASWTGNVSIAGVGSATLAASGAGSTGISGAFTLNAPPASRFVWTSQPSVVSAGSTFPVTLQAVDAAGNPAAYTGTASLSAANPPNSTTTIGTGPFSSSVPLYVFQTDCRSQIIYKRSEVGPARRLTGLALNITGGSSFVYNNFTLRLRHTSKDNFNSSAAWESTDWTTAWQGTYTFSTAGWHTFTFTTPFDYDGSSNLMLDISTDNTSSGSGASIRRDPTGYDVGMVYQAVATAGAPTSWSGVSPTPVSVVERPQIRFVSDSGMTVSPATTGSFVNGVWSGSLTVNNMHPSLALLADNGGGISGVSAPISAGPPAPVITAEPAYTGGTTNTLGWSASAGAGGYVMERDTTPAFSAPVASGSIAGTSTSTAGLLNAQAYHYRVKPTAAGMAPASLGEWQQTASADFATATHTDTSAAVSLHDVTLAPASATPTTWTENFDASGTTWSNTLFSSAGGAGTTDRQAMTVGPNTSPSLPVNQGGDLEGRIGNDVGATSAHMLTPNTSEHLFADGSIEGYVAPDGISSYYSTGVMLRVRPSVTGGLQGYVGMGTFTATTVTFNIQAMVNGIQNSLGTNSAFVSFTSSDNFKVRLTAQGSTLTLQVWKVSVSGGVVIESPQAIFGGSTTMTVSSTTYPSGRAGLYLSSGAGRCYYDDVVVTKNTPVFKPSGSVLSPLIAPVYKSSWGVLSHTLDTTGAGTAATVDVLDAAGVVLAANVASGTSLATLPALTSQTALRLRANLASSNSANTPYLRDWTLGYVQGPEGYASGPWSNTVSSTQDATPPVLSIPDLTTSGASATLAGTATDATSGVSTVTVAGNAASSTNAFANWTRGLTGLADGSNSFIVSTSDNAVPANTTSVTAVVYRIASPTGDADNNGISSLLEHALGIPAAAANPRSMLPAATVQTDSGTGDKFLTLQFRRRLQRTGLTYTVQTSTNLTTWDTTGASVQEMSAVPTGDGVTETVTVRVTPAMSTAGKKFVRLGVTTN